MGFDKEDDFELAVIAALAKNGWSDKILARPSYDDLVKNWARILFENNNTLDKLNGVPLTQGEIAQILDQIKALRTPVQLNGFINGGTVSVKRDNEEDKAHFGKEVSLKIYDRLEIATGKSRYQIARQPYFKTASKYAKDRRGDLMLLINGMPVIHLELKKSGVPVGEATEQIKKYAAEGVYSGLFSLVQVFVAMNPEETVYFANPGPDGTFNRDYFFHWGDFNNEPVNDWKRICSDFLFIPMAHQLIGFYTVADESDGVLKVMRSYQCYAANKIADQVAKKDWRDVAQLGGYIWHTTGSGKTLTSFKSAQLIATSKDADKVVFLMDRVELGTQSLQEYRNFAGAGLDESQKANTVQATEDTAVLIKKLKSEDPADTLIVTSIQKASRIREENIALKETDIQEINAKRLVFIVDECHRSVFGDMLITIKNTFPNALFFGFTGTPIHNENQKQKNTTATVFGNELHRYSIADGIRDKNVLGFDPKMVCTFKDSDLRKEVALEQAKASSEAEAFADPKKKAVYLRFINEVPMAGKIAENGKYVKGIEDYLRTSLFQDEGRRNAIVEDILENWTTLSCGGKFHALLATSCIIEAIEYYRLFKVKIKEKGASLKVFALFDPNNDNEETSIFKEEGLNEVIEDYDERYDVHFTAASFPSMKKDIAARLAHKAPYQRIDREPEMQIDLLIVVNQMLTGYDSKWINTLYLDKVLEYENVIQAFSRTNRLFNKHEKPFGTIKYYRRPHTMKRNIEAALKLYSGDKPLGLFVQRLPANLRKMNEIFRDIRDVFELSGVANFERLPQEVEARMKFASLFNKFNDFLSAAKIQGFVWKKLLYEFEEEDSEKKQTVEVEIDETTYLILVKRYQELGGGGGGGSEPDDIPYDIDPYVTTIDVGKIDADYMNSRFDKFLIALNEDGDLAKAEAELKKTFATLSQQEQKYANIFLHDVKTGSVKSAPGKTFSEYVAEYMSERKNKRIKDCATEFGLDERKLREMIDSDVNEKNINEFGRFEALKNSVDLEKARAFFEKKEACKLSPFQVNMKFADYLRGFILREASDGETEE